MAEYMIKEVSKKMKLPTHTIRFYEKEGLLPFVKRDKNGYRVFREEDLGWLDFIVCLKVTGMPVSDLREIITLTVNGENNFDSRRSILLKQFAVLKEKQRQLDKAFDKIEVKLKYFDNLEQEFNQNSKHESNLKSEV
ncbi:MerR family transcriptional regulator [Niallia sp. Man26]|uniref:MerR family transcriptional regulator n=1 Tax=Niallia sp. Man26 TaxID=2912824 RepID=UPI001EDB756F|nr:MerR family transcriptional regulator [Niallia sp. Man26]UPO90046.1 MerR family transcriptional regulator [Niallia sp. Man26]